MRILLSSLPVALLATACAGDDGADTDVPGDPDLLVGRFTVDLVAPVEATSTEPATPGYTSVVGAVHDGAQPASIVWEVAATAAPCQLVTPRVPFCATPCGGSAVCVADDTCQPYATKQAVGTVHATGLRTTTGATEFDMTPVVGTYQPPGGTQLAYPAFAEGAAVSLRASGSDFTHGFTLTGAGIAPLALTSADPTLTRDQPIALTWTAPGAGASSVLGVRLDISHHGGSKGAIECEAPDTGALTIAAPLVGALLDLGAAGFPTIIVERRATSATVIGAGRVELVLTSTVERPVTVPGIDSCNDDGDCPSGQTCQPDLTCR